MDHKPWAGRVISCPGDDSSTSVEGEKSWHSDAPSTDTDCEAGDEGEEGAAGQTSPGDEAETNTCTNQCQHPGNWEAIMEELEGLAYDDPHSDSNATITGADGQ